jgi:hypothetical protein
MNKHYLILSILISIFTINSKCNTISKSTENNDTTYFKDFPVNTKLVLEKYQLLNKAFTNRLFAKENFLYLTNLEESGENLIFVFDTLQGKIVNQVFNRGTKKYQGIVPLSSGITNDGILWFHDLMLSRIVFHLPNENGAEINVQNLRQVKLQNQYSTVQLIDSNTAIGTGSQHTPNKLVKINLQTGEEEFLMGQFKNKPNHLSEMGWKMANMGTLFLNQTNDKVVLAKKHFDEIEIFDLKNQKTIISKGPEKLNPNLKQISNPSGDFIESNQTMRRAYLMSGQLTDQYIYLLYSDSFEMTEGNDLGSTIHIFNYDGKPMRKITLSKKISAFYISETNNTLFAFNPEDSYLYKAILN